ncbi:hypothetical protein J4440_00230 [Candidatus Woesearchaeota archaeon]|nr:hypothetical protein [Candidatus Woesearchaeota archaeon]
MEQTKEVSKEEKVGYHKGCLSTLVAERNELIKLVQITENLMQVHLKELEKLGIKITTEKPKTEEKK